MAYKVGIVGATGAVGAELLTLMEKWKFPVSELRLLASSRSAGKKVEALGTTHTIEEVKAECFRGAGFCHFLSKWNAFQRALPFSGKSWSSGYR